MAARKVHLEHGGYDYSEMRDNTYAACSTEDDCGGDWPMTTDVKRLTCKRCKKIAKAEKRQREEEAMARKPDHYREMAIELGLLSPQVGDANE